MPSSPIPWSKKRSIKTAANVQTATCGALLQLFRFFWTSLKGSRLQRNKPSGSETIATSWWRLWNKASQTVSLCSFPSSCRTSHLSHPLALQNLVVKRPTVREGPTKTILLHNLGHLILVPNRCLIISVPANRMGSILVEVDIATVWPRQVLILHYVVEEDKSILGIEPFILRLPTVRHVGSWPKHAKVDRWTSGVVKSKPTHAVSIQQAQHSLSSHLVPSQPSNPRK